MPQNKCFICHASGGLHPERLIWNQFDGRKCDIEIMVCMGCNKNLKELEAFKMPGNWMDQALDKVMNSKAAKAMITIVPLWIYFKGGML